MTGDVRERERQGGRAIGSVTRALALLDALAAAPRGAGVNELARAIEVNPSTASRLLGTLERGRMVQRQADGRFRLGLHLVALAEATLSGLDVRELARPVLRELVALTGETATLSVPGGADAITVDFVPAQASVVSVARLGRPSVGHATATGKVMLAFGGAAQGRGERALIAYTAHTVTGPAALSAEVAGVRDRGWAQAVGEREPDLNALAAPVLARGGELVGILGLQGPAGRLTEQRREEVLGALLGAAARLSRALGGQLQG